MGKTKSQELSIDDKFYRTLKSEPKKHIPKLLLCRFLKNYGRRIDRGDTIRGRRSIKYYQRVDRKHYWWKWLRSSKSQSMDKCCGRVLSGVLDKITKTIQIHSDLCHYAKKWCWSAYSKFVLLGQFNRRKLYSQMGKQNNVLYRFSFWLGHLKFESPLCFYYTNQN